MLLTMMKTIPDIFTHFLVKMFISLLLWYLQNSLLRRQGRICSPVSKMKKSRPCEKEVALPQLITIDDVTQASVRNAAGRL